MATFVVTSTADDGAGSLRQSIVAANANGEADSIEFDLAAGSVIDVAGGSMEISESLTIDARSIGGITLQGSNLGFFHADFAGELVLRGVTLRDGYNVPLYVEHADRVVLEDVHVTGMDGAFAGGGGNISSPDITVIDSSFTGNISGVDGGGLSLSDPTANVSLGLIGTGRLTIARTSFLNNRAMRGGGLSVVGFDTVSMQECRISDNLARTENSFASCGGLFLYLANDAELRDVEVADNETSDAGSTWAGIGGAGFSDIRQLRLTQVTIANNTAVTEGGISIVSEEADMDVQIVQSTLTGNSASGFGTALSAFITRARTIDLTISNSIVAGNSGSNPGVNEIELAGTDLNGGGIQLAMPGTNLITTEFEDEPAAAGSIFTDDPMLSSIGFYGGSTRTMPPILPTGGQTASPAYNAGDNAFAVDPGPDGQFGTGDDVPLTGDQRGFPRIVYGQVDIGTAEAVIAGDANLDGRVDLADFVILRNNFGISAGLFSTGDFNGDGRVDLADLVILRNHFGREIDD